MTVIRIDDVSYESEFLTEEAKAQLTSLQRTDQKIAELQRDLAIAQTARNTYAAALRQALSANQHALVANHPGNQLSH